VKRVFLQAFGCQMNRLDGEIVLGELARDGYQQTHDVADADVILYNTCAVRDHAEHRVWSHLGQLRDRKKRQPELILGVMGCMAEREGGEILRRMRHVDIVCGTRQFPRIPAFVRQVCDGGGQVLAVDDDDDGIPDRDVRVRPFIHRAFVAVMRGCEHRCTYCVVPSTRGPERSRPIEQIVDEVRRLRDDGVVEVTLLGQNINSYGRNLPDRPSLARLLAEVDAVDGIERIRFITSNPMDMDVDLLDAMGGLRKVCEYLHFPVQSGSNRMLRKMARGYTVERYRELAVQARERVPGIELSSDFIVGFPDETDEDFQASMDLIREIRFQNIFVFKYSTRPGTPAARHVDDVPVDVKKKRNNLALDLQKEISGERNEAMLGSVVEVLVEGPSKTNAARLTGRSRTDRIVIADGLDPDTIGRLTSVRIREATPLALYGVPAEDA
jgi:tRNA-2-methylthio-N6-dimethylallyladenosine synthase